MDENIISQIFFKNDLGKIGCIKKIEIGFTNKVYSIDDKFILKVCENIANEENFEKELFFYNFFKDKISVPKVLVYDKTKKYYNKNFMIYPKIDGDNLYSKWHLMSNEERKDIIKQLCSILKIINEASYKEFVEAFNIDSLINWHDVILDQMQDSLVKIESENKVGNNFMQAIKNFINVNHQSLKDQKIGLVYRDAHFDNILIKNNKIVGILDFERTELSSIDFNLDIIKKMVEYPKKFMSKEFQDFAKEEDYSQLLLWFKEFYPELFNFKDLDKRLDLYALEYNLHALLKRPNSQTVSRMIAKIIHYHGNDF